MTTVDAGNPGPATPSTAAKSGSAKRATKGGKRRGKYNASGERVNGVWMASASQAERYRQLLKMEQDGLIANLKTEVPYHLTVNNRKITTYRLDFLYDEINDRGQEMRRIYEEVKGFVTPQYRITKKLFEAIHQVEISEIMCGRVSEMKLWAGKIP